ncbi:hypothetical protein [Streptomyces katrae]|nr:hypothetical protein [Streptomyces katrae]
MAARCRAFPVSSVFDIAMFVIMWNVFGADSEADQTLFQSGCRCRP